MRQTNETIQKLLKRTIQRRRQAVGGQTRSRHLLLETLEDRRMLALASPPDEPLRTGAGPLAVKLGLLNADPYEDLAALNSDGNLTTAFNGPFNLSIAGLYTLRVVGVGDDTFPYCFQLWNVPAPDITTINVGDIVNGAIETPAVADNWRFAVTAGQKLYVDFQQIVGGATLATKLLDPAGNTVYTANSGLPNQLDHGPFVLSTAGTYTLHVQAFGDDTSIYRFQVWSLPPDSLQTIPTNFPITGQTNSPVERIVYSFQAIAGQQYFFDVINNPQGVYFTLTAPNGSSLLPLLNTNDVLLSSLTASGTYTLTVSSFEFGTITNRFGPFSFQMQHVASGTSPSRDSLGTDFWWAFPPVFRELADPQYYLILGAKQETSGTILAADGSFRQSFYIPAGESITVHAAVQGLVRGVLGQSLNLQKALHIQSLQEISVYGEVNQPAGSEAFTALPVDALGTEHLVMSYSGGDNRAASQLAVIATGGSTTVTIGTASRTLRVLDPNDTTPPVISVKSPSPGEIVTYLTDVLGSVSDANLEFYRLQAAPAGTDEWTTFFERKTAGTAGMLGTFDPTLLQRDIYDLRVLAQDVNGQQTTVTLPLSIEAQAVLGNFTLQFTDLSIPLAGIPIEILRTYDTLDASRSGDFGYGWAFASREFTRRCVSRLPSRPALRPCFPPIRSARERVSI